MDAPLTAVRDLALRAGDFLLANLDRIARVDLKAGTELVTDLDRRCEAMVVEALHRLFPDDAIRGEEGGAQEGGSGRSWYVDPIDGTTNFVHGYSHFCVSIACVDGDGPVLGAVHAPYLDELFTASRGTGAAMERPRRGERRDLPRREPVVLTSALLATGFPYLRDARVDRNVELVRRMLKGGCHGVRRAGSAALDLCHVGAGKLDGYWEMGLRPWDVAAGQLVVREVGGVVSDFAGHDDGLPCESVVAAVPGLHEELLAIIAGVAP